MQSQADDAATKQLHWSLQPITRPAVPALKNTKWPPRNPIDNFIFAKLADAKLSPSPEAPRRILIRRLYFDLIGLPPTPAEVRAFERDSSANAYEKVVEQLLESPQYGERWARHWLDVVRFAETHGFEMNQPRATAWRYRDYVIRAFNKDKPYDRFIIEQIAGDLFNEDAATGFLVGGAWDQVKSPDPVLTAAQRADELHDMVSTTGSAFLGLTVGCARCHNHKFDPIPQTDYYAIKACLSGVQHGERNLFTPEEAAQRAEAGVSSNRLEALEASLTQFEPLAFTGRIALVDPEPSFGAHTTELLKRAVRANYSAGTARGERDDPGDLERIPNFTRGFLVWSNLAQAAVFAYEPQLDGRFHLWLSWACGLETNAGDARYLLDRDGDLTTTEDQVEITRVNQQHFADGTEVSTNKALWSGFFDAGAWELTRSNKIVLFAGSTNASVTAGLLALVEDRGTPSGSGPSTHFLRAAVNARRNTERFAPVAAKRIRFSITRTTDAEPCLDELEVYSAGAHPTNVALSSLGTKASASSVFPNADIHRIEHINDGKVGNSHSWISNERGKGWIELEFPVAITIDHVIWGRDREQQFSDRLPLDYRIETATGSNDWRLVASSQDRVPYVASRAASLVDVSLNGLSDTEAHQLRDLLKERAKLEARLKELSNFPMVYAGKFTDKPEPIHRLARGDPMQEREIVEPAGLSAIPVRFNLDARPSVRVTWANTPNFTPTAGASRDNEAPELPVNDNHPGAAAMPPLTPDQQRRFALASWIANPSNPLPARVMINRIWQHHFGEGLVSTPSDFGRKGALPSHPELLDWLAAEFICPMVCLEEERCESAKASPWSLKHIHRLIVTSATYRQSSLPHPNGLAVDAGTRLLWRYPPQRLEAEPLRDSILAISGKLDLTPGGPGFSAFEPNDNYVRVYNPRKEFGPSEWRRMIYMTKVRMQQDATFGAFDCPDGGQIAPKRMHSTTPLQALNLLNSEFLVQQSAFFAERLQREAGNKVSGQIRLAFQLAYNRDPESRETRAAQAFIATHGLTLFCRAIFNSNEFIFVE